MNISQRTRHLFSAVTLIALATVFAPLGFGPGAPGTAQAAVLPDFTDLVDKVGPAVVNIRTTERSKQMQQGGGSPEDEEMQADYTRDFLTLAYSHPTVVGVQLWGFWERAHLQPNRQASRPQSSAARRWTTSTSRPA